MTSEAPEADAKRCPVCGRGVLVDLGFDADPPGGPETPQQQPDARQVERYSCGHEVVGAYVVATPPCTARTRLWGCYDRFRPV